MDCFFPEVTSPIQYEGITSKNPLAFRYYNPEQVINGKTMEEHLRFAVAYWHTYKGSGQDPFGSPSFDRAWNRFTSEMDVAKATCEAAFEFFTKLSVKYYCFHDRDLAPEGNSFSESCKNLETLVNLAKTYQAQTGIKLLWGTANLFGNPRYTHGAGTNPDLHVFAYAAAQIKQAMAATHALGGENYVFWGGREGYDTLLNTDMRQEADQMAALFHMAVDYAKKIGFKGQFLIEPKPKEPTKHQYDFDAATVLNFLKTYDLSDHFKLNIEANHATLAGHSFAHELTVASDAQKLGSVDINRGDPLLGWDTDQFPTDLYDTIAAMMVILKQGGLGPGGLNFDAKLKRGSTDTLDLFYAHIGGMDTFARGLIIADNIIRDGLIQEFTTQRYHSWSQEIGQKILKGGADFDEMEAYVIKQGEPVLKSGRQEYLENIINRYI
jgi:xylose isomerase